LIVHDTWGTRRLLSFLIVHLRGPRAAAGHDWLCGLLTYTTLKRVVKSASASPLAPPLRQIRGADSSRTDASFLIGSVSSDYGVCLSRCKACFFDVKGIDQNLSRRWLILFSATLVAAWIPARRASRVDPIVALLNNVVALRRMS
jgi:hypothetical protein